MSRARLQALIREGHVSGGGTIREARTPVKPGTTYIVNLPPARETAVKGEGLPLDIVYEDDFLIVIDKPAGLVVHPAAGHASGTLVNALIAHCGREPFRHRRRQAAGHRAPLGQGYVRPSRRRKNRCRAPGSQRPIQEPRSRRPAASQLSGVRVGQVSAPQRKCRRTAWTQSRQPDEDCGRARRKRAARRRRTTRFSKALPGNGPPVMSRCCASFSRPAARIKYACISRISAIQFWEIRFTGAASRPASWRCRWRRKMRRRCWGARRCTLSSFNSSTR